MPPKGLRVVPAITPASAPATRIEGHRWLWDALWNLNADIVTSKLVPHDWDWNQVHPIHGTPLMAIANEGVRLRGNTSDEAPVWSLLRWCLSQGADPRREASGVSGTSGGWGDPDTPFPKLEPVKHAGHSAISLVIALELNCRKHEKEYDAQIKNARKMLQVLAEFVPRWEGSHVPIPEAVVDIWEAALHDESRADVELRVTGACGRHAGTVRAHALVLTRASPVLEAALCSPMREGQTGLVQVESTSVEAVRLLLQLMYSGTIWEDPEVSVLLGTLDCAHRWQVGHVVAMAERALATKVTAETFGALCEAAVLKELPVLRTACRRVAVECAEVQGALERGEFGPTVSREFGKVSAVSCKGGSPSGSGGVGLPKAKRRRSL